MIKGQDIPHLPPGKKLFGGRYTIRRFIGAGGFGCTYEAVFASTGARVAIKEFFVNSYCNRNATGIVSVGTSSQVPLVRRLEDKFKQEAQNLFRLQHPNIVHVSDFFGENGTSYYVMDYIDGLSLQSIISHDGPLSESKALRYLSQVMDALEYVHGKNLLHLDIKPDNIMVDANDNAILIDFGVSKQYDEIDGHNTSTILGHTPGFAPPEQSGNNIKQFTPASDIYALGATLYCTLVGKTPPSSNDIISGVSQFTPLPPTVSVSTRRAIAEMMQPNFSLRPQNIATVRRLLSVERSYHLSSIETEPAPSVATRSTKSFINSVETEPAADEIIHDTEAAPTPIHTLRVASENSSNKSKTKWLLIAVAAFVFIASGIVFLNLSSGGKEGRNVPIMTASDSITMIEAVIGDSVTNQSSEVPSANIDIVAGQQNYNTVTVVDQPAMVSPAPTPEYAPIQDVASPVVADNPTPVVDQIPEHVSTPVQITTSITNPVLTQTTPTPPTKPTVVTTPQHTTQDEPTPTVSGQIAGHDYVDMGTKVKWATSNVGASSPQSYGTYFAWGAVSSSGKFSNKESIVGNPKTDAARSAWGGNWRMPTKEEFQELLSNCKWQWYGSCMVVTAKNGNMLFFPAAGNTSGDKGKYGFYWSASSDPNEMAWYLYFDRSGNRVSYISRTIGMCVRPVCN